MIKRNNWEMLLTAIVLTMMVVCCGGKTSVNNNNQADSTALSDTTRYAGLWAEKTAERVVAQFTPTNNGYNVEIGWREEGLAQYEVWTMTAHAVTADSLTYTNGKYVIRRFEHQGDTAFVEETVYTDGTGSFALTTNGDLLWTDLKEEPDNRETLFMRAQFSEEEEKETTTN